MTVTVKTRGRRLHHATPRQRQILAYVAGGHTSDDMAKALGMAPATARTHMRDCLGVYHVHSKAAAVAMALALGDLLFGEIVWKQP